jgi:hypothetical protein
MRRALGFMGERCAIAAGATQGAAQALKMLASRIPEGGAKQTGGVEHRRRQFRGRSCGNGLAVGGGPAMGLPVPANARLRSGRTTDETRHAARGDPARAGAAYPNPRDQNCAPGYPWWLLRAPARVTAVPAGARYEARS